MFEHRHQRGIAEYRITPQNPTQEPPAFRGASLEKEECVGRINWGRVFLAGIGIVWGYAAIRPRYGPGPRTAAIAGIGAWFFAGFLANLAMMNMGLFPRKLIIIGLVWGLVEYVVAAVAGASVYRGA
jgi:hypothetical protein